MLRALRASGKKVFLLTNSLWDFTNVVMNYLVDGREGEAKNTEWMELFDAVVTGSCKPDFFESERAAIFEVDVETSTLRNTDDGAKGLPSFNSHPIQAFELVCFIFSPPVCGWIDKKPRTYPLSRLKSSEYVGGCVRVCERGLVCSTARRP